MYHHTKALAVSRLSFVTLVLFVSAVLIAPLFVHAAGLPDGSDCTDDSQCASSSGCYSLDSALPSADGLIHGSCGIGVVVPNNGPRVNGSDCSYPQNCQSGYCNAESFCADAPAVGGGGSNTGSGTGAGTVSGGGGGDITTLYSRIMYIINRILVPLLFAVAFIVFLWGIFEYFIAGAANEEKRKLGKQFILYALIGFFVMISVWGLVNVLVNTFGLSGQAHPNYPLL